MPGAWGAAGRRQPLRRLRLRDAFLPLRRAGVTKRPRNGRGARRLPPGSGDAVDSAAVAELGPREIGAPSEM